MKTPFHTPMALYGDPTVGIHFNLFNNIWDTNYPLWYPFEENDGASGFSFKFTVVK